ncbi:CYTH domain-containing protein [Bosea sp. 2KB_26]|uniref:CYTH domain-containing protein n=1 Tax=Bosea sp. 2KB_26 TaxID=3237475 RepID=UPI003F92E683
MGTEIERKFLVIADDWRERAGPGQPLRQGYLTPKGTTSVRIRCAANEAFLTIKGETHGLSRPELEYEIPVAEAEEMLRTLCIGPPLEKTRYRVDHGALTWEVDVFAGRYAGLVLAEVELTEATQHVDCPSWIGLEVTNDPRYRNAALAEGDVPPPASP